MPAQRLFDRPKRCDSQQPVCCVRAVPSLFKSKRVAPGTRQAAGKGSACCLCIWGHKKGDRGWV
jgi:hypothetical protein